MIAAGAALCAGAGLQVVGPGIVLFGLGIPWVVIGFNTALQRGTPGPVQGRAYSAADTALSIPQMAGVAVGALLVDIVDYRLLLAVMAMILAGSAASLARRRTAPAKRAAAEPLPMPAESPQGA